MVNINTIREAEKVIRSVVKVTPCMWAGNLEPSGHLWLKLESANIGGSFKIRGATNVINQLKDDELKKGIVAVSAGNHAQGVAFAAAKRGVQAHIFMPKIAPTVKIKRTKEYGGVVHLHGESFAEAAEAAHKFEKETGAVFVHAFDHPSVVSGQGVAGLEILTQVPDVEQVVIPTGGGGLLGGVACAIKSIKPEVKVFGVQADGYPGMHEYVRNKARSGYLTKPTIADGIAIKGPSDLTIEMADRYVDDMTLVSEEELATSVYELLDKQAILAEPAAAAAWAGYLKLKHLGDIDPNKTTVAIISGGNIDLELLTKIIQRAQVYAGKKFRFSVNMPDQPGSLLKIVENMTKGQINCLEVYHSRKTEVSEFRNVVINVIAEADNIEHKDFFINSLKSQGYLVKEKEV